MKFIVFASLLLVILPSHVRAEEKPFVRVQIIYVDAAISADQRAKYVPPQNVTVGDALTSFTANLKNESVPYNVTNGTDIITPSGLLYANNGLKMQPVKGSDPSGPDVFLGPLLVVTPTIEKDDLVSIDLHYSDKEIITLPNVPSAKGIISADGIIIDVSLPIRFKAHSGSTVYLGDSFGVRGIARFAFAKISIIPPGFPETAQPSPYPLVLIDTHLLADKKPATKPTVSATFRNDSPDSSTVAVDITDIDVSPDLVGPVTDAMTAPVNHNTRLLALSKDAVLKGRTFIITHGIRAVDRPRPPRGGFQLDSDQLSPATTIQSTFTVPAGQYLLQQRLYLASRLNPDGTAAVDITVKDHSLPSPGSTLVSSKWIGNIATRAFQNFHDGQTIPLFPPFPHDGVNHLIFATVTILPSPKE